MPTIDIINGIYINIYNGDHNPPHIHALYNEYEIRINIKTGKLLTGGSMPNGQLKKIAKWLENPTNKENALKIFKALNPSLRS